MSEVKFHPGLPLVRAPDDCLCSTQRSLKCWLAANSFQTVLYQKFSTVDEYQVHCSELHSFSLICLLTQAKLESPDSMSMQKKLFHYLHYKSTNEVKITIFVLLVFMGSWFLSLFPLRFHQQQQQNWFYIDLIIPCSSHPPSCGCCNLQLRPERILTRTIRFRLRFKEQCFRHFRLNLDPSFFASWWRNYLWVIQWLL